MKTIVVSASCMLLAATAIAGPPTDDPAAGIGLAWTSSLKWSQVVDVTRMPGSSADAQLAAAQQDLAGKGGGVVFFPPGEYRFKESILLEDGIVLRGAPPAGETDARNDGYRLGTRFEFPKYQFKAEGDGTPIDTAFKSIEVENPATASNVGVVHIDINRGHILFKRAEDGSCGRNRLVFGCIVRNAAFADPGIPDQSIGQKAWQRHTWRFGAAIEVKSAENLLIANNRLPKSGDDDFAMNGYVLQFSDKQGKRTKEIDGVTFDYDNRPGIYANHESVGGPGGQGPDGTPETHPLGFRKGIVIRNNSIYSTGRCAIGFAGDGTICSDNVIRFARDVWRPTATGRGPTGGASTNDNRAMEIRGWRWTVSNNDYQVYRNLAFNRAYSINDGEGLMHEDHANSTVKDSVLTCNRGNAYLSIYKTAGIDGLLVENNEIILADNAAAVSAIFVCSNRNNETFPTRNVRILNNTVGGTGIIIDGSKDSSNNLIRGNRTSGPAKGRAGGYTIINHANAEVEDNTGFDRVETAPGLSKAERDAEAKRRKTEKDGAERK